MAAARANPIQAQAGEVTEARMLLRAQAIPVTAPENTMAVVMVFSIER